MPIVNADDFQAFATPRPHFLNPLQDLYGIDPTRRTR